VKKIPVCRLHTSRILARLFTSIFYIQKYGLNPYAFAHAVASEDEEITWRWQSLSQNPRAEERPGDRLIALASLSHFNAGEADRQAGEADEASWLAPPAYPHRTISRQVQDAYSMAPAMYNYGNRRRDDQPLAPPGWLPESPPERPRWIGRYLDLF